MKHLAVVLLALFVWVCESDGEIVKPRDIFQGRHVSERDAEGRIVSLCGYVHPVSLHRRVK